MSRRCGRPRTANRDQVHLDHQAPHLLVTRTKLNKSRLVPLHHTTADELKRYLERRAALGYDGFCDSVFVSETGEPLSRAAVGIWFGRLCRRQGMWPADDHRPPRLTSLRHSFAVERMRVLYRDGADVRTLLPTLSVCLGHVRPQESYWYLTATPELLTQAGSRFNPYGESGGAS